MTLDADYRVSTLLQGWTRMLDPLRTARGVVGPDYHAM
jgi:hypothetical protein